MNDSTDKYLNQAWSTDATTDASGCLKQACRPVCQLGSVSTTTVTTIYHFLFLLYAVGNAIDEQLRFEKRCDQLRSRVSEPVMNRASSPKGSSPSTPVGTRCECISCRYRRVCNSPGWALQIRGVSCRHVPSPTHHHLLSPFRCGLRLCVA